MEEIEAFREKSKYWGLDDLTTYVQTKLESAKNINHEIPFKSYLTVLMARTLKENKNVSKKLLRKYSIEKKRFFKKSTFTLNTNTLLRTPFVLYFDLVKFGTLAKVKRVVQVPSSTIEKINESVAKHNQSMKELTQDYKINDTLSLKSELSLCPDPVKTKIFRYSLPWNSLTQEKIKDAVDFCNEIAKMTQTITSLLSDSSKKSFDQAKEFANEVFRFREMNEIAKQLHPPEVQTIWTTLRLKLKTLVDLVEVNPSWGRK